LLNPRVVVALGSFTTGKRRTALATSLELQPLQKYYPTLAEYKQLLSATQPFIVPSQAGPSTTTTTRPSHNSNPTLSSKMAPKKKGNKKAQDDWEAELGESIAPANGDATPAPEDGGAEAPAEDDAPAAGGLMALMRKNKERRKKKGLPELEGEDAPGAEPAPPPEEKAAPAEANIEDEFALPEKKGKGGKGKQQAKPAPAAGDDETDASGRVLTKAEKEKAKKEREKQRKKEQVSLLPTAIAPL